MSSKVIKWFKRQASIRRFSDKSEDKSSSPQNSSEEKRKTSFPRLSFRKRNKKKAKNDTEAEGTLAVVGISKKLSVSVPKEMESNAKESFAPKVSNSTSVCFGSISLTNSPNKTEGYTSASELSYHSSFDYSKDNANGSLSISEKEVTEQITQNKEDANDISEMSKASNYDNSQAFHSVNSSIHSIGNTPYHDVSRYTGSKRARDNAPIVKMEEICDIISDKEHPEEIQSDATNNSVKDTRNEDSNETSVYGVAYETRGNKSVDIKLNLSDSNVNGHLTVECDDIPIIDQMEASVDDEAAINCIESDKEFNVFEEIDRLVHDASSLAENEVVEACNNTDAVMIEEVQESENGNETVTTNNEESFESVEKDFADDSICLNDPCLPSDESDTLHTPVNEAEVPGNDVETNSNRCNEETGPNSCDINVCAISSNIYHDEDQPEHSVEVCITNENHSECSDQEDAVPDPIKTEDEFELFIREESDGNANISESNTKEPESNLPLEINEHQNTYNDVQITLTQPSPTKHSEMNKSFSETISKPSSTSYPEELNPFGDEEPASTDEEVTHANNKSGYHKRENEYNHLRENASPAGVTTYFQGISSRTSYESSVRERKEIIHNDERSRGDYNKSLNPFDDSDNDEDNGNSTNPFEEEEQEEREHATRKHSEARPSLPPKSAELQNRKNSKGSLAPIPHPRKSKQSLHGSYTSLQNVPSSIPIPAPRSITPFGSTKTLSNDTTNPFDDNETENNDSDSFERRGIGRSSMQALPTSSSQEPLARTKVRGSLPPSSIVKVGKKKRQAPLPPGFSQRKPPLSPCDFSSLPRKRSTSYDERNNRHLSISREISPHRLPPPRPPPPKITF